MWDRCFANSVGCKFCRVFTVGWKIWNDAAEADGAETFGDGQVVFFSTGATMKKNEVRDLRTGRRDVDVFRRELFADKRSAFGQFSIRQWNANEARCSIAGGETLDVHSVVRRIGEIFAMIIRKGSPRWIGDLIRRPEKKCNRKCDEEDDKNEHDFSGMSAE